MRVSFLQKKYNNVLLSIFIISQLFEIMTQEAMIVQEYYKNPVNNHRMSDYTVSATQWNSVCWDTVEVFLKIENGKVLNYSYFGEPSMITWAAASLLSDLIIWSRIDEIVKRDKNIFDDE